MPLQIVDSIDKVQLEINRAYANELNKGFLKALPRIERDIKKLIPPIFFSSFIYGSLVFGELKAHFGLSGDAKKKVDVIINAIRDESEVILRRFTGHRNRIDGGLTIGLLETSYKTLLSLPEAKVRTRKGQDLPWLEWLLTKGDAVIILDYDIKFTTQGRSGRAIMVNQDGAFWKVPGFAAGTPNNNWLTKELNKQSNQLMKDIGDIIVKHV